MRWAIASVAGWLGDGPPVVAVFLIGALTVAAFLSPILATGWVLYAFASEFGGVISGRGAENGSSAAAHPRCSGRAQMETESGGARLSSAPSVD